jgi:hypothetical protein
MGASQSRAGPSVIDEAMFGQWGKVLAALRSGYHATATDDLGNNILHWAARSAPLPVLATILDAFPVPSVAINTPNNSKQTPLYCAALHCDPACMALLLDKGGDANWRVEGDEPLLVAVLTRSDSESGGGGDAERDTAQCLRLCLARETTDLEVKYRGLGLEEWARVCERDHLRVVVVEEVRAA